MFECDQQFEPGHDSYRPPESYTFLRGFIELLCRLMGIALPHTRPSARRCEPTSGQHRFKPAVDLVSRFPRGLFRSSEEFSQKLAILLDLVKAFPKQSFLIVPSKIDVANAICKGLRGSSEFAPDVEVYHSGAKAELKSRIAIATWHYIPDDAVEAENRDIVIVWDASDLEHCGRVYELLTERRPEHGFAPLGWPIHNWHQGRHYQLLFAARARLYAFAPPKTPVRYWVRGFFGFEEAVIPRAGKSERESRYLTVSFGPSCQDRRGGPARGQTPSGREREDFAIELARRFRDDPAAALADVLRQQTSRPLDRPDPAIGESVGCVVLADNLEHALQMADRHDLPVLAGQVAHETDARYRERLARPAPLQGPYMAIATPEGLRTLEPATVGMVIRLDGRPGLPALASGWRDQPTFRPLPPVWWIEIGGQNGHPGPRWRSRREAYRAAEILEPWQTAAELRVDEFLADPDHRRRRGKHAHRPRGSGIGYQSLPGDRPVSNKEACRRRRAQNAGPLGLKATLQEVYDFQNLLDVFDRMRRTGGQAPGLDGLTYHDFTREEICNALRQVSACIKARTYRPQPAREVSILKHDGDKRVLRLANVIDRVVAGTLSRFLCGHPDPGFDDRSNGFRPNLNVAKMLIRMERYAIENNCFWLLPDDVKKAFDNVPIGRVVELLAQHGFDPKIVKLAETILQGGDDDKTVGIGQGCPLSPQMLNRLLDPIDKKLRQASLTCFRYADNLLFMGRSSQEVETAQQTVRELLAEMGMSLKGQDGPARDIRTHTVEILGFKATLRGSESELTPSDKGWNRLEEALIAARDENEPDRQARRIVSGWISAMGPALSRENRTMVVDRILNLLDKLELHEALCRREVEQKAHGAWTAWRHLREKELQASGSKGVHEGVSFISVSDATNHQADLLSPAAAEALTFAALSLNSEAASDQSTSPLPTSEDHHAQVESRPRHEVVSLQTPATNESSSPRCSTVVMSPLHLSAGWRPARLPQRQAPGALLAVALAMAWSVVMRLAGSTLVLAMSWARAWPFATDPPMNFRFAPRCRRRIASARPRIAPSRTDRSRFGHPDVLRRMPVGPHGLAPTRRGSPGDRGTSLAARPRRIHARNTKAGTRVSWIARGPPCPMSKAATLVGLGSARLRRRSDLSEPRRGGKLPADVYQEGDQALGFVLRAMLRSASRRPGCARRCGPARSDERPGEPSHKATQPAVFPGRSRPWSTHWRSSFDRGGLPDGPAKPRPAKQPGTRFRKAERLRLGPQQGGNE